MFSPASLTNPTTLFNKNTDPKQQQAMQQLNIILGGLGNAPAAKPIAPALFSPPPQPAAGKPRPILGGTVSG